MSRQSSPGPPPTSVPGPWSTLAPEIPSNPSQVYEAIVALAVLALIAIAFSFDVFREPTGRALLVGIAIWAFGRVIVGMVWRDPDVVGPLGVEQLLTLAVGTVFLALAFVPAVPADRTLRQATRQPVPDWPDPSSRPPVLTTAYPRGPTTRARTPPRAARQGEDRP